MADRTPKPTPDEPQDALAEEAEESTLELDAAAAVELLNAYVPKPAATTSCCSRSHSLVFLRSGGVRPLVL